MRSRHIIILILAAVLSLACTTKVSEWVLLNDFPEKYTLMYLYNSPLNESAIRQNTMLRESIKAANINFRSVAVKNTEKSCYALYYGKKLFARYDDYDDLRGLTTSPVREKTASELMNGKLCVLLYLLTGDREKDERGLQNIHKALGSSPYKDIITVIELSRDSKEEAHFVSMLLNVEDDLKTIKEPMLFGIFGKFKALEPLLGKGITEGNVKLMFDFLTADCSCLIKDNLPGMDILFTDKWDNPKPALVNKILDDNPALQHR